MNDTQVRPKVRRVWWKFTVPILLGVLVLIGSLYPLLESVPTDVEAAPVLQSAPPSDWVNISSINTTTTFLYRPWDSNALGGPSKADVFLLTTQDDVVTATFTLQVSPRTGKWIDHPVVPTLASSVVTNTNSVTQVDVVGRYFRVVATLATTGVITPEIYVTTHP